MLSFQPFMKIKALNYDPCLQKKSMIDKDNSSFINLPPPFLSLCFLSISLSLYTSSLSLDQGWLCFNGPPAREAGGNHP